MSVSIVSPVFIGRRDEITALAALLDRARTEPAFAVIGGEAGVGKTRLVGELTERASGAGFQVLTGQCIASCAVCQARAAGFDHVPELDGHQGEASKQAGISSRFRVHRSYLKCESSRLADENHNGVNIS